MSNHYCRAYNGRVILNGSFSPFWLKIAPFFGTSLLFLFVGIVSFQGAIFNQKGKNEPFSIIFFLYVKRNNNKYTSNHYCCIKSKLKAAYLSSTRQIRQIWTPILRLLYFFTSLGITSFWGSRFVLFVLFLSCWKKYIINI